MAPRKTKAKAKAKASPLEAPAVSAEEVKEARKALEDKAIKHRANSNLMYWLQSQGKREGYDSLTAAARKEFALHWYAWSLKGGNTVNRTLRQVSNKKN